MDTIFGEPRAIGERTVIHVARLAFGFGAGSGTRLSPAQDEGEKGPASGGGGGGGIRAQPVGLLIITDEEVRFVSTGGARPYLVGLAAGVLVGLLMAGSLMRRS